MLLTIVNCCPALPPTFHKVDESTEGLMELPAEWHNENFATSVEELVKDLQGEETRDRQPTLRPEVSAVRCQLPPLWPW